MLYTLSDDLTPVQAFRDYVKLKLHFNGQLIWNPDTKGRLTEDSLDKRKDASFFYNAAKSFKNRLEYVDSLVTGFVHDPNIWIGDAITSDMKFETEVRIGKIHAIMHNLDLDLEAIGDYLITNGLSLPDILASDSGTPKIHSKRRSMGDPRLETLCVLDYVFGFTKYTKDVDPLWFKKSLLTERYKYFCLSKELTPQYLAKIEKLLQLKELNEFQKSEK